MRSRRLASARSSKGTREQVDRKKPYVRTDGAAERRTDGRTSNWEWPRKNTRSRKKVEAQEKSSGSNSSRRRRTKFRSSVRRRREALERCPTRLSPLFIRWLAYHFRFDGLSSLACSCRDDWPAPATRRVPRSILPTLCIDRDQCGLGSIYGAFYSSLEL